MKSAPSGQEFVFCDGTTVENIGKLVEHIKKLSPEQFSQHLNAEKNDFYNWIRDCIDSEVAEDLRWVKTQRDMVEKLTGHHWLHEHRKIHKY